MGRSGAGAGPTEGWLGHALPCVSCLCSTPGTTHLAASFMPQSSEQYLEPGWAARTQPGPRHCGSDAGSLASALSGCFHLSLCFCFCRCRLYLSSFCEPDQAESGQHFSQPRAQSPHPLSPDSCPFGLVLSTLLNAVLSHSTGTPPSPSCQTSSLDASHASLSLLSSVGQGPETGTLQGHSSKAARRADDPPAHFPISLPQPRGMPLLPEPPPFHLGMLAPACSPGHGHQRPLHRSPGRGQGPGGGLRLTVAQV